MHALPKPLRALARPIPLALTLGLATAIPLLAAAVSTVQIAQGTVPADSQRLLAAPVSFFLHALAGVLFGLTGPAQFVRALRRRFGRLHRALGVTFVTSGLILGASGLSLLAQVPAVATPPLEIMRALTAAGLVVALILGLTTRQHRDWMIRAYAIGMGSGTVALVFFPIVVVTGEPPRGLTADLIFVGWWSLNILLAEGVLHHLRTRP